MRGASLEEIEALYRSRFERFATVACAVTGSQAAARDAVQDAFASAVRRRGQFRRAGSLEAWLWRTVVWHTRTAHGWNGWQFPMFGRSDSRRALFDYAVFGGSRPGTVEWATLVGFARGGVTRVVVSTRSGARRALAVDRRGTYAYAATRPAGLPRMLTAFDAAGHVLGHEPVSLPPAL